MIFNELREEKTDKQSFTKRIVMNFNLVLYNNAVNILGVTHQMMIAMEECAELSQAISKCYRYHDLSGHEKENDNKYKSNLTEEIADVLIMIEQLRDIYNIKDNDIQQWIDKKEERLKENLIKITGKRNDDSVDMEHSCVWKK